MEVLFYLAKSATVLTLFYIVYAIVLRKDTLFNANRHYLLAGVIASVSFPLIEFTKTIYIEAPVSVPLILSESIPETQFLAQEPSLFEWWQIIIFIYLIGVVFMFFKFTGQLYSLLNLLKKYPSEKVGNYTYVKVAQNSAPFSFFKHIVFNPRIHSQEELMMIIKHEQIHGAQWHSLDIIVANLFLIFQWMNPLAWLYKKGIEENLEFIADSATVQQVPSIKKYQLALVKASSTYPIPALTNKFYQSFIKKRILMLNKSSSNKFNIWKLSIILPLLAIFLWSFNVNEVIEYTKNDTASVMKAEVIESTSEKEIASNLSEVKARVLSKSTNSSVSEEPVEKYIAMAIPNKMNMPFNATQDVLLTITKDTTKEELDAMKSQLKQQGFSFDYSNVEFNENQEVIGIAISYKDANGNSGNYNVHSDSPINTIVIKSNGGSISVRSGSSGSYSNSNNENHEAIIEARNEEMRARNEEMRARHEEMRNRMEERHNEMEKRREKMHEEMEIKRNVHREEREVMREEMREQHRTDSHGEHHRLQPHHDDSGHHLSHDKSSEIHAREHHRRMSMENLKSISKNASKADLDQIKQQFKAEGITFSYKGVKRNNNGEIIKIKLRINNNNGSDSQSNYDGDGEAIKTIYLGSNGQTTIMTTKR